MGKPDNMPADEVRRLARLAHQRRVDARRLRRLAVEADAEAARVEASAGLVPPVRDWIADPPV